MAGGGPSNFRVQGKVYHSLGPLLPDSGQQPKFAQLYIYDTDSELQNRLNAFSGLRPALLSDLQTMLHQNNHWVQLFKTAAAAGGVQLVLRSNMGALRLLNLLWCNFTPHLFQCLLCCFCVYVLTFSAVCSAEGLDRRRYNVPTASEVAAILPGDGQEEDGAPTRRDIVVQLRGVGCGASASCIPRTRRCTSFYCFRTASWAGTLISRSMEQLRLWFKRGRSTFLCYALRMLNCARYVTALLLHTPGG